MDRGKLASRVRREAYITNAISDFLAEMALRAQRGINAGQAQAACPDLPGGAAQLEHWRTVRQAIEWLRSNVKAFARERVQEEGPNDQTPS